MKYWMLYIVMVAAFGGGLSSAAWANDPIRLTYNKRVEFGMVDTMPGAYGDLRMGTDGAIDYPAGASGVGSGSPGRVVIEGPVGTWVTIRCEHQFRLARVAGRGSLILSPVEIVIGAGDVKPYGQGYVCDGLNVIARHRITGNMAQDTIYIGGNLRLTHDLEGKSYAAHAFGGQQNRFRVDAED